MANNKDWLKRNHTELHAQVNTTWNYMISGTGSLKYMDWGYQPGSAIATWITNEFKYSLDTFNACYTDWSDAPNRTKGKQQLLETSEAALCQLYRELYGLLKGNRFVTDEDLIEMELPARSTGGHTPTPPPSTIPEANSTSPSAGKVEIHFRDFGSKSNAKPAGIHGAEICWAILDTPPTDWSQLTNSSFDTHTPLQLTFGGDDRGKRLYYALRWENTIGVKGGWTEILSTIIP